MAQRTAENAQRIFSQQESSFANGAVIDTGWLNMEQISKYQIMYFGSAALSLVIESREADQGDAELVTPATYSGVFYLADLPARQKWIRMTLTNNTGSTVTGVTLAVGAIYGGVDGASVFPLEVPPSQFSPAMLVQSVQTGLDTSGVYRNTSVNAAGAILVSDFGTEVARGLYSGYEVDSAFGRNPDIDTTTTPEDFWNGGSTYTGFNATANENIEVLSASAADAGTLVTSGTATGGSSTTLIDTGATFSTDGVAVGDLVINDTLGIHGVIKAVDSETQVTVYRMSDSGSSPSNASGNVYRIATTASTGVAVVKLKKLLNANFQEQTDAYVIMNGTTGVILTGNYMRCSRVECLLAGSGGVNAGQITTRQATTTANVFSVMPTTGQSDIGAFSVPDGKFGIIKRVRANITRSTGAAGSANCLLNIRPKGQSWRSIRSFEIQTGGGVNYTEIGGIILLPFTDAKLTITQVSDNNTIADGAFEYFLVDE